VHANLVRKLRTLRKESGLTQHAFAEMINLDYKYYQKIETGKTKDTLLSTIEDMAEGLQVEPWELLHPQLYLPPATTYDQAREAAQLKAAEDRKKRKE